MKTLITALALLASCSPAAAQSARNCGEREAVIEHLATGYGESRQMVGLGTQNRVVETYANLETGTWTITVTMPNGVMCLLASGYSFEAISEPLEPAGQRL